MKEPDTKRAGVFFDGQNLFHAAKEAFGYTFPNYDPVQLAEMVCRENGWELSKICFYTGVPAMEDNAVWHRFWVSKLGAMGHKGVKIFSRALRYRNSLVRLPDGREITGMVGQEKGVDVRIAIDVVSAIHHGRYDVIVLFSQDQDLSEVADEVRHIAQEKNIWVKIASAFPVSLTYKNKRGIDRTDWIRIGRVAYEGCIDPRDYRPAKK